MFDQQRYDQEQARLNRQYELVAEDLRSIRAKRRALVDFRHVPEIKNEIRAIDKKIAKLEARRSDWDEKMRGLHTLRLIFGGTK